MKKFKRGDKLIVELIDMHDVLEGEYIDGDENRLTLINITSCKTKTVAKGPYTYYRSEISSAKLLESQSTVSDFDKIEDELDTNKSIILIDELEYERLKTMSENYTYITARDSKYNSAIQHINTCKMIGILGVASSSDKASSLSLICFSTRDHIYIIDFLAINTQNFPRELENLLESIYIKKVVHDLKQLRKILRNCFNIKLNNVFDIAFADIALRKKNGKSTECMRSLAECLEHYFHFPPSLIGHENTVSTRWGKRPMSDLRKFRAAQMVAYLLTLKDYLEGEILSDFSNALNNYSHSSRSNSFCNKFQKQLLT